MTETANSSNSSESTDSTKTSDSTDSAESINPRGNRQNRHIRHIRHKRQNRDNRDNRQNRLVAVGTENAGSKSMPVCTMIFFHCMQKSRLDYLPSDFSYVTRGRTRHWLQYRLAMPRSHPRQGVGIGKGRKPLQGPKKGLKIDPRAGRYPTKAMHARMQSIAKIFFDFRACTI